MTNPEKQIKLHKEFVASIFTPTRTDSTMISAIDSRIPGTVPRFISSPLKFTPFDTPLHYDDTFEIFYLNSTSDSCSYIIGNSKYAMNPGELLFIPMGLHHCVRDSTEATIGTVFDFAYEFINGIDCKWFQTFFDCAYLHPWLHERSHLRLIFRPAAECLTALDRTVHELQSSHERISIASQKIDTREISEISKDLNQSFSNFMRIIHRTFYKSCTLEELQSFEKYRPPMLAAINYIESNFQKKITLSDICDVAGYKTAWFSKLFREIMQISPIEYLNFVRTRHARRLLVNSMTPIGTIAEKCGFNSPQHFDRTFKQYTGCSPRVYRMEYIIEYTD